MAAGITKIRDENLRSIISELSAYLDKLLAGQVFYSSRKLIRFRNKTNKAFARFVSKKQKEIRNNTEKYGVGRGEVKKAFQVDVRALVNIFERNVVRAFGQAIHSLEKSLKVKPTPKGKFGIWGLISLGLLKNKPKYNVKENARAEGLTRLTGGGKLFTINLVSYLIMLIRTAQVEFIRRLNSTIAFRAKIDLVRISPQPCWLGPQADEVCNRWRDRIVSMTGFTDGFPKLDDALREKPPLFHPNCKHTMIPLTPQEEEVAIRRKVKFYATLKRHL